MKNSIAAGISIFALSACATIVGSTSQPITFKSTPDGANFSITNRAGEKIHTGTTPATITLNKGAGYFKSESYTVKYEKAGYATKEFVVSGNVNGWYFGNIIFGGLIVGMLIVDPLTGAMFTLDSDSASQTLNAIEPSSSKADDSLRMVTIDDVPPLVMQHAHRIN